MSIEHCPLFYCNWGESSQLWICLYFIFCRPQVQQLPHQLAPLNRFQSLDSVFRTPLSSLRSKKSLLTWWSCDIVNGSILTITQLQHTLQLSGLTVQWNLSFPSSPKWGHFWQLEMSQTVFIIQFTTEIRTISVIRTVYLIPMVSQWCLK